MLTSLNFDNINEPKDNVTYLNQYVSLVRGVNNFTGKIGSYFFLPIGFLMGKALLYVVKNQNKKTKVKVDSLIDDIPNLEIEDLINLHLQIERLNKNFAISENSNVVSQGFYSNILYRALSVISDTENHFKKLEKTLLRAAYPDQQRELSKNEFQILKDSYANCDLTDWEDESMNIYEDYYILNK
ncbi:hypothetical protein ACR777_10550 [Sphingobacterium spiritivorum]|uniref:hypothetical protein n=1 Tax=Sphingobacterium spiritivorum TaxID=258 RepID=UPI003DA39607